MRPKPLIPILGAVMMIKQGRELQVLDRGRGWQTGDSEGFVSDSELGLSGVENAKAGDMEQEERRPKLGNMSG